jgi:hypothetical protein
VRWPSRVLFQNFFSSVCLSLFKVDRVGYCGLPR